MYTHLLDQLAIHLNKAVWKLKLLLEFKIFVWFFLKEVVLTKCNLVNETGVGIEVVLLQQ
jgi:hypothetical protein